MSTKLQLRDENGNVFAKTFVMDWDLECPRCANAAGEIADESFDVSATVTHEGIIAIAECKQCAFRFVPDQDILIDDEQTFARKLEQEERDFATCPDGRTAIERELSRNQNLLIQ